MRPSAMPVDQRPHDPQSEKERAARVAASLMRMSLALLDRAGEGMAAVRLQQALDTLERRPPGPPSDAELDAFVRD